MYANEYNSLTGQFQGSLVTQRSVAISARISVEDAAFISSYSAEGAKTPSDKLRAIIADCRQLQEGSADYKACNQFLMDLLLPLSNLIREKELEKGVHSEIISRTLSWLPEVCAYLVSAPAALCDANGEPMIEELEKGLADRVVRFIESILQLGFSSSQVAYNTDEVSRSIYQVAKLATLVRKHLDNA